MDRECSVILNWVFSEERGFNSAKQGKAGAACNVQNVVLF